MVSTVHEFDPFEKKFVPSMVDYHRKNIIVSSVVCIVEVQ